MERVGIRHFQTNFYEWLNKLPIAVTSRGVVKFYVLKELPTVVSVTQNEDESKFPLNHLYSEEKLLQQLRDKALAKEREAIKLKETQPTPDPPVSPEQKARFVSQLSQDNQDSGQETQPNPQPPSQSHSHPYSNESCQANLISPDAGCSDKPLGKFNLVIQFEVKELFLCQSHLEQAKQHFKVIELFLFDKP